MDYLTTGSQWICSWGSAVYKKLSVDHLLAHSIAIPGKLARYSACFFLFCAWLNMIWLVRVFRIFLREACEPLKAGQSMGQQSSMKLSSTIDTRVRNGLETHYILWLWAWCSHMMTSMGYMWITNGHNALIFCWNILSMQHVFFLKHRLYIFYSWYIPK